MLGLAPSASAEANPNIQRNCIRADMTVVKAKLVNKSAEKIYSHIHLNSLVIILGYTPVQQKT